MIGAFSLQNLFYELIQDKDAKRHIKLIQMLQSTPNKLEFSEIQSALEVTLKTVKNDVFYIEKRLPRTLNFIVSKYYLSLVAKRPEYIQDFILELVQKTFSYRILNYVYDKPSLSIENFSKRLFTSESTLKVRILYLNQIIKRFRCKLSSYKSEMIGSEADIRCFYYAYFSELQELLNFSKHQNCADHFKIFTALQEEIIAKKLKKLNFSYFQLRYWLQVTTNRISAGHCVIVSKNFKQKICAEERYQNFLNVYIPLLSDHFNLQTVSEDECIWAYTACLNAVIYSHNFPAFEMTRGEAFMENYNQKIQLFLSDTAANFGLNKKETKAFLQVFRSFFINLNLLISITPTFTLVPRSLKSYIYKNFRSLVHTWHSILSKMKEQGICPVPHMDDICCSLAMISSQFVFLKKPSTKKVLFSFSGQAGLPTLLETNVRNLFEGRIQCVFVFNELLNMQLIERIDPEIVVCNYNNFENLPFPHIIRLPHLPEMDDWTALIEFLLGKGTRE